MSTTTVVLEALNQQINAELGASYEYLAMSAWCRSQNLLGTAKWLRLQSQEEYGHAMKLYDFVLDRGGEVSLKAMAAPMQKYASLHDVFERVSKQEQAVSGQIDSLYDLAFREKAFSATVELQWFLTEQVEEERSAREILAKLKLIANDPAALLDFDRDLGNRTTAE
ncbi:MAG TPA: ferritin [Vicinamibacterales bacterium]|jgi:ferritin|nr:ferritin [Vicinamibacterales bacterium]